MAQQPVDLTIHPSGIVPQLQNVVATVNLGCKLDLKEIALHARNAEYNPKVLLSAFRDRACSSCSGAHALKPIFMLNPTLQRFAAVIMRIREPKTTALIFASGKMVRVK